MGVKPHQKRRRAKLYDENPYCPICGIKMILPDDIPKTRRGNLKYHPRNLCTLEHPITRLEPDRRKNNREMLTIMCKECNENKASIIEKNLGIERLHELSGRGDEY